MKGNEAGHSPLPPGEGRGPVSLPLSPVSPTDGTVNVFYADGTTDASQKVGLLKVADESKLMKQGSNLYDFGATGSVVGDLAVSGTNGLGTIQAGTLEMSNVDLTDQFAELITTQRSFQAGSRLITVSDSVLEDIVNLKRS